MVTWSTLDIVVFGDKIGLRNGGLEGSWGLLVAMARCAYKNRFLLLGGLKTGSTALRFGLYPMMFIGAPGYGHQEAPGLQTPVSDPDFVSKNCYIQG